MFESMDLSNNTKIQIHIDGVYGDKKRQKKNLLILSIN